MTQGPTSPIGADQQRQQPPITPPSQIWQGRLDSAPSVLGPIGSRRLPITCYRCGQIGHIARACTGQRLDDSVAQQPRAPMPNTVYGSSTTESSEVPVYLKLHINGKLQYCLLDTGSQVTLIPSRYVKPSDVFKTTQRCLAANGTRIPLRGHGRLRASLGGVTVHIQGLVSDHIPHIMLGSDWMSANKVNWCFGRNEINIRGRNYRLDTKVSRQNWCRKVILVNDTTIPARSQVNVSTKAIVNGITTGDFEIKDTWATESKMLKDGLFVARSLMPDRTDDLPVRLLNTTDQPIELKRDTVVTSLEPVGLLHPPTEVQQSATDDDYKPVINEVMSRTPSDMSPDVRQKLEQLLYKYKTILSRNEWDLGNCTMVSHQIDTGDAKPIRQQLRRYPPLHRQAIDQHLLDMTKQGVIEPTASPWASNIVLAKKKDGSLRCCIDYRQLNEVTVKDAYPLPRIDMCMDALAGSAIFSTVDLKCGYFQIDVSPEDRCKTAFITSRGMYAFRKLPFGLANAPPTFQRFMDLLLSGLSMDVCLAYLDDLVLHSKTPEEHLERLEEVFRRLQDANLKLKPSKCSLMQTEISFLGYRVSGSGIATDPSKTELIDTWPVPENLRQLRGFMGLASYYRRFVRDFAKMATPLNRLLRKDQRFEWTDDCQEAFDALKTALTSPPVLALPRDDDKFILDTDASEYSIGAVLSVVRDGLERVVAYAGRALSRGEVNYCVTRKELLAIVYFVDYFRQYLLGRSFEIRTDHAALSWLKRTPEPIGQNARWLEILGEYDYHVGVRRGKSHGNADALSRHPCLSRTNCTACRPTSSTSVSAHVTVEGDCDVISGQSSSTTEDQSTDVRPLKGGQTDQQQLINLPDPDPGSLQEQTMVKTPIDVNRDTLSALNGGETDYSNFLPAQIAEKQRLDPELRVIIDFLESSAEKPPWSAIEMQPASVKAIIHEWQRLSLRDNVLCRKWTGIHDTEVVWQVIMPRQCREAFIMLVHSTQNGGHMGRSKTQQQVQRRAYWPGWREQVANQLKSCNLCAEYHRGKAPKQNKLQPFGSGEPMESIAIDVTGPHPISTSGKQYIVTVIDLFSRWAEAYAVTRHTAPIVAQVLTDNWFCRYGMPRRLLSDQGTEFESLLFTELCNRFGIDKLRCSPYKASTNGQIERFHKTMNSVLAKTVDQDHRNWDRLLPSVMAAYRATIHSSTGYSPNSLILGHENVMPIDLVLGKVVEESEHFDSYNSYVKDQQERLRVTYQLAREHLGSAAERRKIDYDTKVKEVSFKPGDWVYYYQPKCKPGLYPKWTRMYTGPYCIVDVIPPADYLIRKTKRARPFVTHGDKLRRCHNNVPTSPDLLDKDRDESISGRSRTSIDKSVRWSDGPTGNSADTEDVTQWQSVLEERPERSRRRPRYLDDFEL